MDEKALALVRIPYALLTKAKNCISNSAPARDRTG